MSNNYNYGNLSISASYKNNFFLDKPNEDYIIADDMKGIYILLDGVSVDRVNKKYPNPSPALEATKIFAKSVYRYLSKKNSNIYTLKSIKEAITLGNKKIREYNDINKFPFPSGTVGIVATLQKNIFYYSFIGDCFGRLIFNNIINCFSEEQTYLVKINKKQLTTHEIRFLICNNINHPYGYGVYNGDPSALNFVKYGMLSVTHNSLVILSTDGFEPYLKNIDSTNIEKILERASPKNIGTEKADDRSIIIIRSIGND